MALIQPALMTNLMNFDDSLNSQNGNVSIVRKMSLMDAYNKYAQSVTPPSSLSEIAKLTGLAAFVGDDPNVPKSFAIAWGTALGSYTPILATGMLPLMYVPTVIPMAPAIIPGLVGVQSVQDKVSQISILATAIDSWMHTGISTLTIPPAILTPTPWI